MPHSFHTIWVHAIWSTKKRQPLIRSEIEEKVYDYMRNQFKEIGCPVRIINGMPDHVHSLFLLNPKKTLTEIIKQVKGSTSHWINQQDLIPEKFSWQVGSASYSVSESVHEKVFKYIDNQKEHHKHKSFKEEYDKFMKLRKLGNG
ncbi:MAG: IS200/IS605 family transposase [Gracilimonas sp.]|nr:IS200/IS605 family transposase [Gracilimonas sp.]